MKKRPMPRRHRALCRGRGQSLLQVEQAPGLHPARIVQAHQVHARGHGGGASPSESSDLGILVFHEDAKVDPIGGVIVPVVVPH